MRVPDDLAGLDGLDPARAASRRRCRCCSSPRGCSSPLAEALERRPAGVRDLRRPGPARPRGARRPARPAQLRRARLRRAAQRLRAPARVLRDRAGRAEGVEPGSAATTRPMPAVFIRAPVVESVGPAVEVLASLGRAATRSARRSCCGRGTCWPARSTPSSPRTGGCTGCSSMVEGAGTLRDASGRSQRAGIAPRRRQTRCRATRSGPPPSTARARRTRRGRSCSPSSSARSRWRHARAGGDINTNASLRTMYQKARDASVPIDTIERAIKRGTRRARGRPLRGGQLRGLRTRWRRGDRRDPDRQPQPHRLRRPQPLLEERRLAGRARRGQLAVRAQGRGRRCRARSTRSASWRSPWTRAPRTSPTTGTAGC